MSQKKYKIKKCDNKSRKIFALFFLQQKLFDEKNKSCIGFNSR